MREVSDVTETELNKGKRFRNKLEVLTFLPYETKFHSPRARFSLPKQTTLVGKETLRDEPA